MFKQTDETHQTKWNLSHHFANEVKKYIFWLDYDIDVIKVNYNNKRPDIIFHKRGTNVLKFLVLELKRNCRDDESDLTKIKEHWMNGPLSYSFGAYVNIWAVNEFKAIVFSRQGNQYEITPRTVEKFRRYKPTEVNSSVMSVFNDCIETIRRADQIGTGYSPDFMHFMERNIISQFLNR